MILLITPSARAQECAQALHEATSETTQVAATLRQAATQLRTREYLAVVVDESVTEAEPDEWETALQHIGTAIPVYVNFAISGISRIVRELRMALNRRKREALLARQEAEQSLRSELKGDATALLLSCEMLLQVPELPAAAEARIRTVYELARGMCGKLATAENL